MPKNPKGTDPAVVNPAKTLAKVIGTVLQSRRGLSASLQQQDGS